MGRTSRESFVLRRGIAGAAACARRIALPCLVAGALSGMGGALCAQQPNSAPVTVSVAGAPELQPGDSLELSLEGLQHSIAAADLAATFVTEGGSRAGDAARVTAARDRGNGSYVVTVAVPEGLSPANYKLQVSGNDSTGQRFAATSQAAVRIDPAATVFLKEPSGRAGQSLAVEIEGKFADFVSGPSQASFGAGVSVGGAAKGAPGPLKVIDAAHAVAVLQIDAKGADGSREVTVMIGRRSVMAKNAFTVLPALKAPLLASGGPYTGVAGMPVDFDGTGSSDPNGSALTLSWNSGDNATTTGAKAQHAYAAPGVYAVTLTGTDAAGASTTVRTTATIVAGTATRAATQAGAQTAAESVPQNAAALAHEAPQAMPGGPYAGTAGESIAFDGTGSSAGKSDRLSYLWSFGDGESATGATVSHTYATPGSYSVILTVDNGHGGVNTATTSVVVPDVKEPVASTGGPYVGTAGIAVDFTGAKSTDPNKYALTYAWTFGDGGTATGEKPTHIYKAAGAYAVALTVNDGHGGTATAKTTATIVSAPVADPGGPYKGIPEQVISFDGTQSEGPVGKTLTFTWNFGDKGTATGATPTHKYAAGGTFVVTLTVSDGVASAVAKTSAVITSVVGVKITSPAGGTLTNKPDISVSGTVATTATKVTVNGAVATVAAGKWTAKTVALREGVNLITATATDKSGNTGTANVSVTLDTTPPSVSIVAPAPGAKLFAPQVAVSGLVSDLVAGTVNAQNVTVTVNGVAASVVNRSFFAPNILLSPGSNKIDVVATDKAGNTAQAQVQVNYKAQITQQSILLVSGNGQTGLIGSTLAEPLVAQLVAANGQPVANRPVTFTVTRSDGQVTVLPSQGSSLAVLTDAKGHASVLFQLGSRAGVGINQVTATSPGFTGDALFTATSTNSTPAFLHSVIGEHQRGVIGQNAPQPFQVIVTDHAGNPLASVPVIFTVTAGGGNIGGATKVTQETNADGKATVTVTLGMQEGTDNNLVSANFTGNKGSAVLFHASGLVPGPAAQTSVTGVVLDNTNTQVSGATVSLEGTSLRTKTNAQGQFTITKAPVGTVTLLVDGSTSSSAISYPSLSFVLQSLPGVANSLDKPIYLPKIDTENAQTVGGSEPVTLTMTGVPGVAFTVQPNSVTFPDGSHVGKLSVSQVKADMVPMAPVNGVSAPLVWTIQPAGAKFNPPIQVQLPNTSGMAPGAVTEIYQYDHDLEQFVSGGTARVSPDGSVIESDPGFGIVKAGWGHQLPPPPPINCTASCDDDNDCTNDSFTSPCGCSHTPTSGNSCGKQSASDPGKNTCYKSTGICKNGVCNGQKKPAGSSCDDGVFCTNPDTCNASGACIGKPIPDTNPVVTASFSVDLTKAFTEVQSYVSALTGGAAGSLSTSYQNSTKYSCCEDKKIKQAKDSQQTAKISLGMTIAKIYVPQYTFSIPGTPYKIGPYASFGINEDLSATYHVSDCIGNCIDGGFSAGGTISAGYGGDLPGKLASVDVSAQAGVSMGSTFGCHQVSWNVSVSDLTGNVSFTALDGKLGVAFNVVLYPGGPIATGSANVP